MTVPFKTQYVSSISINSSHIIDRTITTADIALATIDISNLSASCISSLSGGGGGLTADSVNSSHIINGSILAEDICNNTITGSKIAVGTITSSNILDRTILGIDISLSQISEAHLDASFTTQLIAFGDALSSLYTGIFEITCNTNINVDFYYEEGATKIYLFQNVEMTADEAVFTAYSTLPTNFPTIPFYLASDQAITSYSLTYASPTNGITSHSQVGAGKIQFNILRNSQHYLELNIYINI